MAASPLLGLANPFRDAVVTDVWQPARADVPELNARAMVVCEEALRAVAADHQSTSVLIHGMPGSGKTHLLARLRALWTAHDPDAWAYETPRAVVVAVRLQTGPRMIWRFLRRSFADDLLRFPPQGVSQLERVLLHRFAEVRPAGGDLEMWWGWLRSEHPDPGRMDALIAGFFDQLDPDATLGRDVCTVLGYWLQGRHRRDVRAWLRGDPLPDSALARLDLVEKADDDLEQEDRARETVLALCRLAAPRVPVVFCFDQVEALQVHPQDHASLHAFGQMITSLYHETSNSLLISCVQSSFFEEFRRAVREAHLARIMARATALSRLDWPEAERLIAARLDASPELAALRAGHPSDRLWPLSAASLRAAFGEQGRTARECLFLCAEEFEAARGRPLPEEVEPVASFLQRSWEEQVAGSPALASAESADEVVGHALPLLIDFAAPDWQRREEVPHKDLDLAWDSPHGRVGVSLCNQRSMAGLAARLRRLREALTEVKPVDRLLLVRDPRLRISRDAKKTRTYLDDLIKQGARLVQPSPESLAALDALRRLLSDAKAGDLAHAGQAVAPATVLEWLADHPVPELGALVQEITAPAVSPPPEPADELGDRLLELLDKRHVVALAEVAAALGVDEGAVSEWVLHHPGDVGLLEGPPAVLFRRVPADAESPAREAVVS